MGYSIYGTKHKAIICQHKTVVVLEPHSFHRFKPHIVQESTVRGIVIGQPKTVLVCFDKAMHSPDGAVALDINIAFFLGTSHRGQGCFKQVFLAEVFSDKLCKSFLLLGLVRRSIAALFPVRSKGIPINIKNTNRPQDEGTWIVESTAKKSDYTITGIAGKKGFCACLITKGLMNSEIGFGRKVLQSFEDNGISFEHMPSGIDTMTVVVHEDEFLDKEQQVVSEIHRFAHPDSIEIESDLALIAVVGRGMKSMRGTAGRIFSALAHRNVNVRMIDQGSSELNIIIGVANQDFETAIEAIYDIFVNTQL